MGGRNAFRRKTLGRASVNLWLPLLLVVFALCPLNAAFAQPKPERKSKAAKPTQTAPTTTTPPDQKAAGEEESAKAEDKPFKGMKYRLIGPFRGGRSLTAAGIPGDPTTYYFGSTGGGVGEYTNRALTWAPGLSKKGSRGDGSPAAAQTQRQNIQRHPG